MSRKLAVILGIAALLLGVICYIWLQRPESVEPGEVKKQIVHIEETAQEFTQATAEHRDETKRKVVVIREEVRQEISALDADGLALAALEEIELFRRSAGGGADPRAAGLDGK